MEGSNAWGLHGWLGRTGLPGAPGQHPPCPRAPPPRPLPRFLWRRQYCEDEPDWAAAVELLSQDDGAGWALLRDLATGGRSAAELAASRFCEL